MLNTGMFKSTKFQMR